MAVLKKNNGKPEEAKSHAENAYEIYKRTLGPDHNKVNDIKEKFELE